MKKIAFVFAVICLSLLPQTGVKAQVLAFSLDGEGILSFKTAVVDVHDVGDIIDSDPGDPQGIFLYVNRNTPLLSIIDFLGAVKSASTYPVAVLNPADGRDHGRTYGPRAVYFREYEGKGKVIEPELDAAVEPLFSVDTAVVVHTPATSLSGERFFRVLTADVGDFGIYVKDANDMDAPLQYNTTSGSGGVKLFLDSFVAFRNLSQLPEGKGYASGKGRAVVEFLVTPLGAVESVRILRPSGLAGLDDIIVDAVRGSMPWWTPPVTGGKPCYARVAVPVQGEIGL